MVIVLMIVRDAKSQRRRVLARTIPKLGLRIVTGTTKSEVRMMFFSQSTLRPCGENCSPRMLPSPAKSLGCSAIMLKLASVSTSRPGEVPAAANLCQSKGVHVRWKWLTAHVRNQESTGKIISIIHVWNDIIHTHPALPESHLWWKTARLGCSS
jgi:hypothetical protein